MLVNSRLDAQLAASQEGLSSMGLVIVYRFYLPFKVKVNLSLYLINETLCREDIGQWRYSSTILDLSARWK
jgi:hypothetical protein